MQPREDLKSRALQWLHQQPADGHLQAMESLTSIFPNGPCPTHNKLDIIVADAEGMFYSVLQSDLTDFFLVLESSEGLGDPDHVYKRRVKKGAHRHDIS